MSEHAPFQTLQATIAFALLGVHEWAPYAVSGALLFFVVFAIGRAGRDLPPPTAATVVLPVLALFWGFILRRSSLEPGWRNQGVVVLSAAAALLFRKAIHLADATYFESPEEDQKEIGRADYAFLSEGARVRNYPGDRLNASMLVWVKQQPSFVTISDFVDTRQKHNMSLLGSSQRRGREIQNHSGRSP